VSECEIRVIVVSVCEGDGRAGRWWSTEARRVDSTLGQVIQSQVWTRCVSSANSTHWQVTGTSGRRRRHNLLTATVFYDVNVDDVGQLRTLTVSVVNYTRPWHVTNSMYW